MNAKNVFRNTSFWIVAISAIFLVIPQFASAHCDTLDGPVVKDAQKAIEGKDITPILKWVKPKDEKAVRTAFSKVLAAKGEKVEVAHKQFFATLIKIHRAGEGAPFTGLKPAGTVEPAVAEADKALESGSSDALVKLLTDDVAAGIKKRFEQAAATYSQKDKSVAQGREFVEAYVEFTHYVERLHQDATGANEHGEHKEGAKHAPAGHGVGKH